MGTGGTSARPHATSPDAALSFRVLGPLEVLLGALPVEVGGRQERALLALLLTAPGRVFSVSAITAGLWGEQPPGGADRTVLSYVSRLRRGLPAGAAAAVVTRRPGYLVDVDPDRVDAERFRSGVRQGRRDLDAGAPGRAAERLEEALALWRGDPYAEFDAPFAVAERRVLEELRLVALEDRADAVLHLGGGSELVGELETLVGQHPLRERLWAQLMTALYRSGRQGDALLAYQRARCSLVDELGVQPGDELRSVHAQVLAHDPALLGPAAPQARRGPGSFVDPTFVGRVRELDRLQDAYGRLGAIPVARVLVTGPHGMGKTRLLAELARSVRAAGGRVVDEVAAIGSAPTGAPALLVLDDLHRRTAADLVRLRGALRSGGRPALVVGTCVPEELAPEQAEPLAEMFPDRLTLPPLTPAEVAALAALYVPGPALAGALAAPEMVAAAGVPLAVHAAAGRYGETTAAAHIQAAARAIAEPRRRLEQSRDDVVEGVGELERLRSLRRAHTAPAARRPICPFKGLAHYDVDDAPFFAGRERLVARLVARLVDAPMLAVVGASGSGKSSVVRAGLVAALTRGVLPGSERWRVVVTTPARPAPVLPPATGDGRTLLVVDQLEELYTAVQDPERTQYADWLTAAAERDDVTAVVAVRSDYFARAAVHRRLADLLAANTVLVGAMSPEELRRAVEAPAAAADLEVEPGLAETVAREVAGEPGGLPLLSTALLSLWEHGGGRRLSLASYHELGGVRTAVSRLAEAAYAHMTPGEQVEARRLLLRLAEVDDAGQPVRRRVALSELSVDGNPDTRAALDTLALRRLLTVSATHVEVSHEALLREWPRARGWLDDDESGRRMRSHLVPAAAAWRAAGQDPAELYRGQRLTAALDFLADHPDDLTGPETEFLRAGRDAADADAAARRRSHRRLRALAAGLAVVLALALGAGWVALDRQRASARLAVEADVRALRAAALGEDRWDLALLYAAQAYRIDRSPQSRAALQRTVHRSPQAVRMLTTDRRLVDLAVSADGRFLAGLSSAGTAYVWDARTGARTATVPGLTEVGVSSLDISPDGRHLAVVGVPTHGSAITLARQVMVVDLEGTSQPSVRTWWGPEVSSALLRDGGRVVVTVGNDGRVREIDLRSGRRHERTGVRVVASDTVALDGSLDRRFVVAADPFAAGRVTVWESGGGRVVWSSEEPDGTRVAVSPDGTALLVAHADGSVDHVDLPGGVRRSVPADPSVGLVDLDWAPDGSSFAGATVQGTVAVWDAGTLEPRTLLTGHAGTVSQVVHSPDGSRVYASGYDGAVVAWDLTGAHGVVRRVGNPESAGPLGPFGAPSRVLATGGSLAVTLRDSGALELMDVPDGRSRVVRLPPSGFPAGVLVDAAGRHAGLFTVSWPELPLVGEIQVVDVATGRRLPHPITVQADYVSPLPVFTGDGRSVVTVDLDGRSVRLWDVRTGRPPAGSPPPYRAREDVVSIASDATGRLLALGVRGGRVEVADTGTPRLVRRLVPPGGENLAVRPLVFSPDGRWLAGGSESGRVVVWDTATWRLRRTWVAVPGGGVDSLAFTPDSRAVVAGGAGTASIWDVDPGAAPGMTLDVGGLPAGSEVAVAPLDGGRTVATLTADQGVQLWGTAPGELLDQACRVAGRNLTRAEWDAALPTLPYARTCPGR